MLNNRQNIPLVPKKRGGGNNINLKSGIMSYVTTFQLSVENSTVNKCVHVIKSRLEI